MLTGVRVLDLTTLLPGPYATWLLADLGADVVKVESRMGDLMRQVPPRGRARGAYYLSLNRNKRSIGLNVSRRGGRDVFLSLARASDVIVEGFRPGRAARLGIGPDDVRAVNERAVYCSISGYGQSGPDAGRSGHDLTYLARAGVLALSRDAEGRPAVPPVQVADLAAGTNAALAICAALLGRERTGRGTVVDVSMLESALAWMGTDVVAHQFGHGGTDDAPLPLSGGYPFYRVYRTSDGGHVALAALEPIFWSDFCRAVDRPDLTPKQFAGLDEQRATHAELERLFGERSAGQWADAFADHDLPAEVVRDLDDVLADPQLEARGALLVVEDPDEGALTLVAPPFQIAGREPVAYRPAPHLAADTWDVLREVLDLTDPEIHNLIEARAVFGPEQARPRRVVPRDLP